MNERDLMKKAAAKLKQQQMTENDPSEKRLQIKKFFFIHGVLLLL
jgi:hypothetical protein